jgi:N-acetylglutamate synthase-like GNAT family acetyltransferase
MIAYRQATRADAPAILSLLQEIMEHHGAASPGRERLATVVSSIIAASEHCFLVAQTIADGAEAAGPTAAAPAGSIVGMCALVFTLSTWSAALVCELQDVIVSEDYRREDVGRGLFTAAEEIARARGCSRLFLLAESWNLGAHSFYRSLGLLEKTCLYFERDLTGAATA